MAEAKFEWKCPKYNRPIRGISENTLKVNKAQHEKWHEIND